MSCESWDNTNFHFQNIQLSLFSDIFTWHQIWDRCSHYFSHYLVHALGFSNLAYFDFGREKEKWMPVFVQFRSCENSRTLLYTVLGWGSYYILLAECVHLSRYHFFHLFSFLGIKRRHGFLEPVVKGCNFLEWVVVAQYNFTLWSITWTEQF